MIIIACVDDNNGMLFNHRRQSQDRTLRAYILQLCQGKQLWMNPYSAKQFQEAEPSLLRVDPQFLSKAAWDEPCFVEDEAIAPYENRISRIFLFKWNTVYPADTYFDISLSSGTWHCTKRTEFPGNSHKKITMEVYEK